MENYFKQLFLYTMSCMYLAIIIFSLLCFIGFKEILVIDEILKYYLFTMTGGAMIGGLFYHVTLSDKHRRDSS